MNPSLEEQLYWEHELEMQGLPSEPIFDGNPRDAEIGTYDDQVEDELTFRTIFPKTQLYKLLENFTVSHFNEAIYESKRARHSLTANSFFKKYHEEMKFLTKIPLELVKKSIESEKIMNIAKRVKNIHKKYSVIHRDPELRQEHKEAYHTMEMDPLLTLYEHYNMDAFTTLLYAYGLKDFTEPNKFINSQ